VVGRQQDLLCGAALARGFEVDVVELEPYHEGDSTLAALRSRLSSALARRPGIGYDGVVVVHAAPSLPVDSALWCSVRRALRPGGALLVASAVSVDAQGSGGIVPADAAEVRAFVGNLAGCDLEVGSVLPMTQRPYEDRRSWLELQRVRYASGELRPVVPFV